MRALLILLAVSACSSQIDPYTRDGMWQPNGANSLNLAAMTANPYDLVHGHGDAGSQPVEATGAVDRLLSGRAKPLAAVGADATPGSGGGGK